VTDLAVAITGASGYLGSRAALGFADVRVRALVRAQVPWLRAVEQVPLDLLQPAAEVAIAFRGVDAVIHLAGHNEVIASSDPDRALAETVIAARHVAEAAAIAGTTVGAMKVRAHRGYEALRKLLGARKEAS